MINKDPRADRKFPDSIDEWAGARAIISNGASGSSLEIMGFQVMQEWETPLMERMARSVSMRGASVLEVGFGLGICARFVQAQEPRVHVIIEANRMVATNARRILDQLDANGRIVIIEGCWEDVVNTPQLRAVAPNGFDGVIFDTFPLSKNQLRRNHFAFFPHVQGLLAPRGKFTYFSDEMEALSFDHQKLLKDAFPNGSIYTEKVTVSPWRNCEYWESETILHVLVISS